jgi:ketosteroid isomerase-like protein
MKDDKAFASLEARVRRIEDTLAIYQLISAYGPAADSEDLATMDKVWDENCLYDIGDLRFDGREQLKEGIVNFHSTNSNRGSGHCGTMPHIVIEGDRAWATHHSVLILQGSGGYVIARLSASRWAFARQASGGWLVVSRLNRGLDGSSQARQIFAAAAATGNEVLS